MEGRGKRVDYDAIADRYDATPYRERKVDPLLEAFAAGRGGQALRVLDIGCGTGNQLIANRAALPALGFVGLDRSPGMLRQARRKAPVIGWVAADAAALPFAAGSFDFACCQFAFHHIAKKAEFLREAARVLRPEGRFVLHNLCPQRSPDWLYYKYFPEAQLRDLEDFWPPETIVESMRAGRFATVEASYQPIEFTEDLPAWLDTVRRRDTCSQLQAISDAAYCRGVARLERDIADPDRPRARTNRLCLLTITAAAPGAER
jgi:ubiquinone/menaquinone biosynthesis C-methylase UbiE